MSPTDQHSFYRLDAQQGTWHSYYPGLSPRYVEDRQGFTEDPGPIGSRLQSPNWGKYLQGWASAIKREVPPNLFMSTTYVTSCVDGGDASLGGHMLRGLCRALPTRASSAGQSIEQIRAMPGVSIGEDDAEVIEHLGVTADALAVITELRRHVDTGTIRVEADGDPECPTPVRVLVSTDDESAYQAAEEGLERFDEDYWLHQPVDTRGMISVYIA